MNIVAICISFLVAILGLSYPILLQVIARLDEKYSSNLTVLFRKEIEYKLFTTTLYFSLLCTLMYITQPFLTKNLIGELPFTLNVLIGAFLIISTTALVTVFILLVQKTLRYYSSVQLVEYIISKHKSRKVKDDKELIEAMKGVLLYTIKHQNNPLSKLLSDHIYSMFSDIRKGSRDSTILYPDSYYQMVYDVAQEVLLIDKNKLKVIEHRAVSGIWLIGEFVNTRISAKTYTYLWQILLLVIEAKKEDLIVSFWENSVQYYRFSLSLPERQYSSETEGILNENEIKLKESDRNDFQLLHMNLGGLLLYKGMYNCIKRIFRYTFSEPPDYILLPKSMTDIFSWFYELRDDWNPNDQRIKGRYWFPGLDGLAADSLIRNWNNRYVALLFLRQYMLYPYYVTDDYLGTPKFPSELIHKQKWLDHIDQFSSLVQEVKDSVSIMKEVGFENYGLISDDWCRENNKPTTNELVTQIKEELIKDIDSIEITQVPLDTSINRFKQTTNSIIASTLDEYLAITNKELIVKDYYSWHVRSIISLFEKKVFLSDHEEIHGYDTVMAEQFSFNFQMSLSETFDRNKTRAFLLPEQDLFDGIRKLQPKPENHIIVAFGITLDYFIALGIKGLSKDEFLGIKIVNIPICNHRLVGQSLFILSKSYLPGIHYHEVLEEDFIKYNLTTPYNDTLKLYTSVIDLNQDQELRDELKLRHKDKDLRKYVLCGIWMRIEIRWKKKIDLVKLSIHNPYDSTDLPSKLKDINPLIV